MHSQMGQGGMMGRGIMSRGMMGHMQRMMDRLTQQLDLSNDQQMKVQDLLRTHAREGIRLKVDIDAPSIDIDQVKTTLQAIAAKEADLHLAHLAAMQDIQQPLPPEQQEQFRDLQG